ncbi:MAG: tRNA preQ1(34) S-adenosylmethionine ribosyltransferase-isomerase QueA, partial [Pseudomonadales bacterium]|nr:tRNA preQ1(34) S-adenosylmethionine ribosyltransferase-isomerase QueA [Pseudomonadales bacterium]
VVNDTRVIPARLTGSKPTGGQVELLLERPLDGRRALLHARASKAVRPGLRIETPGGAVEMIRREGDLWIAELPATAFEFFESHGQIPLPPYIAREPDAIDRDRYQSRFARHRGAVAAPTASLHFDDLLLSRLEAHGVETAFVTLHVGAGTFQPVRSESVGAHVMHAEFTAVGEAVCLAVRVTKARGKRVIAVGTTVVRALETATANGELEPYVGDTRLFVVPGFRFQVVDAMITNFHLPESTLLMLVSAFAGREHVLAAYAHAIRARYRFFSYGDAMFVTPSREVHT